MRAVAFALVLAAVPGVACAAPARKAAAAQDWSRHIVRVADGAYRLGNPAAKVKVAEYLSLTCSHCAHFATAGLPVLVRDYVRGGRVSIEFRHAVRDGFDMAASLLARCGGPARYLGDMDALFRAQPQWLARAEGFTPPDRPEAELPAAYAEGVGLTGLVVTRGLPRAAAVRCLRDPAATKTLLAMRKDAFETKALTGTPGFFIDGRPTGVSSWEPLRPLIDAALR